MRICLIFLTMLLATQAFGQDRKLQQAREAMGRARQILDASEDELIATYLRLEEEFDKVSGPHSIDFTRSLGQIWFSMTPEIKSIWQDLSQPGRSVTEKRFEDAVTQKLTAAAVDKTRRPSQIVAPFRKIATSLIYDAVRKNDEFTAEALQAQFQTILTTRTPFFSFWNEHLFMDVPQAKDFASANEALAAAASLVDRLAHPTEFDKRGRRAPPGMVLVPGRLYFVGPNKGWDKKRRKVKLRDYYIDKYEVTNKEYNIFLRTLDEKERPRLMPYYWPKNKNHEHYYPEDRADHPVIGISWEAAAAFATWKEKRLPSEEEWEVAATGPDSRIYPWGNRFDPRLCNTRESGYFSTTEVGSFSEGVSPFGCYDMAGNALEWTGSEQDGKRIESGTNEIINVVIRGGSFDEPADRASCLYRALSPLNPYEGMRQQKKAIGFRCARDVK